MSKLPLLMVVVVVGLALALLGCGGEPGTYSKVREVSERLHEVADTNEIQAWLRHEIELHSEGVSKLPVTLEVDDFPGWAHDLNVLAKPRTTVFLDTDKRNDHIAMLWVQSGKSLGVIIGKEGFKLPREKEDCFVIQSYPGVFVWCPK
jgi:hypothetical protein